MVKILRSFIVAALIIGSTAVVLFAQEAQGTENEEDMYFAAGTVVEASADKIIVSEYDFDAGQETNATYDVNAKTEIAGAAAVSDLKAGDDVEIEYQSVADKKVAVRVEKYATEENEAYIDDMTDNMGSDEVVGGETMTQEEVNNEIVNEENRAEEAAQKEARTMKDAAVDAQNDAEQKTLNDEGASIETKF